MSGAQAGAEAPRLLERDAALSSLRELLADATAGRGRLVLVSGAAGTGKSALVAWVGEAAAATGLTVFSARGNELERQFAFGVLRQLFEPVLASATARRRRTLLTGAAAAEQILGPDAAPGAAPPEAGFPAYHAIYRMTVNLAADGPLLLVVDDAHWADVSSLRALAFVAGRVAREPVGLLLSTRPHEPDAPAELLAALHEQPGAALLEVRPLSAEASAALVRAHLPAATPALCDATHAASGGNPLLLHQLMRTLEADGSLGPDAVAELAIPTLADGVGRRIARVAPAAVELTRAMAVLGDGELDIAAQLAGVPPDEAAAIAHNLRRLEVLSQEDPFAFVHPLVRRSIYDELPVHECDAAHLRAAALLEADGAAIEAIAAHLAATRPRASDPTATTLQEAARQALARADPASAIRWLQRALHEGATDPPRGVLLAELGLAEVTEREPAATAHLREALGLVHDSTLRARVSGALAEILLNSGDWQAGRDVMKAAFDELGGGEHEASVEVSAFWAVTTVHDTRLVDEFDRLRGRFEAMALGRSWPAKALAATLASVAATRGEPVPAVMAHVERALNDGRLLAERGAGGWASIQALGALVAVDEYDRALHGADELAERARQSGSLVASSTAVGVRAWVLSRRGDLAAAEAEIRGPIELAARSGMTMMVNSGVHFVQEAIVERSSLDDLAALVESTEVDPAFLATWGGAMLLEPRARLRLTRGDRAGARSDLQTLGEVCSRLRFGPRICAWRSLLALTLPGEEGEEALRLAREEVQLARATALPRPYGAALRALGMLQPPELGLSTLRESVAVLESSQARLEHARSLVALGALLRRNHQRTSAREVLSEALESAHRCGAERLVARARQELQAAGARPRRIARTGVDALTPSELRVAKLAAAGATNAEIAQQLFLTVKTVETHLSNAYAKLGLSGQQSRQRLPHELGG